MQININDPATKFMCGKNLLRFLSENTITVHITQRRSPHPRKPDEERNRPMPGAGFEVTECARGKLEEGREEGKPEGGGRLERLEAAEEKKEEEKEEVR